MAVKSSIEAPKLGEFACLVGRRQQKTGDVIEVRSPYDQALVGLVHRAGPEEIEQAISAAVTAFQTTYKLPTWKHSAILEKISEGIAARREELARTVALEAGKPIKSARVEVDRAFFFKVAAEETRRIYGEIVPLDWLPGTEGREGTSGYRRGNYRWMRADPPLAKARTCSTVAMVVSPGKVVMRAPCAQPKLTASCSGSPVRRP